MAERVVKIVVTAVMLGALLPVLWPMILDTNTAIQAIEGEDSATQFLQATWPLGLLIVGIAVAVGFIFYALRKFKVIGK